MCYGRESYRKNCDLVGYFLYKNQLLILPQIWLAAANGFAGQLIYNPFIYTTWNVVCTAIPPLVYCVTDFEYDLDYLLKNPKNYYIGLANVCFNTTRLWGYWMFMGVLQS